MRRMRAALAAVMAGLLAVAPLAGCGGGMLTPDVVVVNGAEPPNPLIPTGTNPGEEEVRRMRDLSARLQELSEHIRKEIPRDAYLASLTGRPRSPSEPMAP